MLCFAVLPPEMLESQTGILIVPRDAIYSNLEAAQAASKPGSILVYDPDTVQRDDTDSVKLTITDAMNGVPYREPVAVTAAGGYVVRAGASSVRSPEASVDGLDPEALEVLLIYRRGVWDLPKGKLDAGESISETALREVREEVGARNLRIVRPLGTTVHGYPDGRHYAVKTTHWFLMEADEDVFTPQAEEGIDEVRWVAWDGARQMLGYSTLREHMASIRR